MAEKLKKSEKLGEVVGKRRIVAGCLLAFFGVFFLTSLASYSPGQEIYFSDFFSQYLQSTVLLEPNYCGKIGATLCVSLIIPFGVAIWMFPTYLIWLSIMAFSRRAKLLTKTVLVSMAASVFLLPILAATLLFKTTGGIIASGYFPCGWGGGIGSSIFESILLESVDVFGSMLIAGVFYMICLIIIFVDSPAEAAKELSGVVKKSPPLIVRVSKIILLAFWIPLKFAFGFLFRSGKSDEKEVDSILDKPSPVQEEDSEPVPEEKPLKKKSRAAPPEDISEIRYSPEVEFSDGVRFGILRSDDGDSPAAEPKKVRRGLLGDSSEDSKGSFQVVKPEDTRVSAPAIEKKRGDYVFPSVELLSPPDKSDGDDFENYEERMTEIVETIGHFGIKVFPALAESGPVITRYELTLAPGIRINKVSALDDEIAMKLKAQSVRIIAPIPGKGTIGVEIPNIRRKTVVMRDIIESQAWLEKKAAIPIVLGEDVTGKPVVLDLAKMPHALIAGSTGSGKSVCINAILTSLLYCSTPEDLRFILVDPKQVELQVYNSLPHMLIPVVSDAKKVPAALNWLCTEMERRYAIFSYAKVRNISGFNAKILKDKEAAAAAAEMDEAMTPEERVASMEALEEGSSLADGKPEDFEMPTEKLPYIVCIVDELADIMIMAGKDVEALISRLTAKARAAGIHLILATQRPSVDVITGVIKANLPFRIAFKTVSATDSRTILDGKGAEMLIGNGDLLYGVAGASPVRAQGAYISDDEINGIVEALKVNGEPEYVEEVERHIENYGKEDSDEEGEGDYEDPMVARAIEVIRANKKVSISFLQRKLSIGYGRAAKIVDILEEEGIVGPEKGPNCPRDIYL